MKVTVYQTPVQRFLVIVITIVALAGLAVEIAEDSLGLDDPYDLLDLFSLSYEANVPTWLSACMHATSALLLALIASGKRQSGAPFVRHWRGLSIVFAYISIDEFVQIHEEMNAWFDLSGALYFGWVIPAAILVSIFVLSYWRFLAHLPWMTRFRFIRAGAVFVGGAMGIELILNAANLNLVAFNRFGGLSEQLPGQVFALMVIVMAACEAAVALAIIINLYKTFQTIHIDEAREMRG